MKYDTTFCCRVHRYTNFVREAEYGKYIMADGRDMADVAEMAEREESTAEFINK